MIADKHDDVMAKLGAILAQGIIDAGGRNMTVSLQSRTGHTNMLAVVGMLVFTQYWYWFSLSHFLSLAFTPSCLIGLNENLDMPVIAFRSNAKPSTYGYPAPLEEKKKEDEAARLKEKAQADLILMMGDAEVGRFPSGGVIERKMIERKESVTKAGSYFKTSFKLNEKEEY